jgi:hypothetical protein
MKKEKRGLAILFCICLLSSGLFSGCLSESKETDDVATSTVTDQAAILPHWQDGNYHDYSATTQMLNDFNNQYSDLVEVFSIGKSVLGRDIWCIKITNENNTNDKFSCLIDGCIHGNEWEAGEACLYLAEFLLINSHVNDTITNILNTSDVYIIPILNPDGRIADERETDNGVDPNRNFDVFFGKLLQGHSFRLGKLFNTIKIPKIKIPPNDPVNWYYNCGRYPFSEPETKALSSFIGELADEGLSFYVNTHTPAHCLITPWLSYKPPFQLNAQEENVYGHVIEWVDENTEYDGVFGQELNAKTGGNVMDWCFQEFRIPSFTYELLTKDYYNLKGKWKHDHLVHWMKTSLPFFMYLLVNIQNLKEWEVPSIQPVLPDGIPPPPL